MEEFKNESRSIIVLDKYSDFTKLSEILLEFDTFSSPTNIHAPSLKYFWLQAFFRNYGASRNLAITIVLEKNIPKLILPLQVKEGNCLEFLCDETSDYNDFLYFNSDARDLEHALNYWISKGIKNLRLYRLPDDSKTINYLFTLATVKDWKITITDCDSIPVVITQPNSPLQNWKGVKTHRVVRYFRKMKALSNVVDVSFSIVENLTQFNKEFPIIKRIHIERWRSIGIQSKYSDHRRESFIMEVCEQALENNSLFLPIMKINGTLASFIIGFRSGDTVFDWNTSFSNEFQKWSPGALLLLNVLSNSKIYGFNKYNFLKGVEDHKFIWTDIIEKNLSCTLEIA